MYNILYTNKNGVAQNKSYNFKRRDFMKCLKRGDIFYVNLGTNIGSEVNKVRPCVVVQNDIGNKYSPTTIVVPISEGRCKNLPTHIKIKPWMLFDGLEKIAGTVLTEQIRTVDKERFLNKIGKVKEAALKQIDDAMILSIGIGSSNDKAKNQPLAI